VFRDGERSATHHPEFTMLEWYRAGSDYRTLMDDCEGLLATCADVAGAPALRWNGRTCDPRAAWQRLSVAEAFARYAGIDLMATAPDPDAPDVALLTRAAAAVGIAAHDGDDWESLFFRIFLERIEPALGTPAPTLLYDYPIGMAALARPSARDARVAERFELYVAGLELANAFSELTDPVEQRRRFDADLATKQRLYGERYPIDEDFLAALGAGFPDSAGIALGVDRLVMLVCGADRIDDVLWAPVV
jgi:lysyl-tRNA synthetase class 2